MLTKGILVHTALERLFELPPTERSLTRLHDTLRDEWRVERAKPDNMRLFESIEEEREWGLQCLKLLDNYLEFEDPSSLPAGEPLATEAWLSASLGGGGRSSSSGGVKLVGKVDRLDAITSDDGLVIVDYKTGKPPSQKYSETMNEKIRRDAFFQLRCYALLLVRGGPPKGFDGKRAAPIASHGCSTSLMRAVRTSCPAAQRRSMMNCHWMPRRTEGCSTRRRRRCWTCGSRSPRWFRMATRSLSRTAIGSSARVTMCGRWCFQTDPLFE